MIKRLSTVQSVRRLASLTPSAAQQPWARCAKSRDSSWSIDEPHARYEDKFDKTVRVLRDSYPKLFSDLPDLSIYTPDSLLLPLEQVKPGPTSVRLTHLGLPPCPRAAVQFVHSGVPEGSLRGIRAYTQLFNALRLTRRTAVADADLSLVLSVPAETTIRVRWHARLWLRMPLPSLVGVRGGAEPLLVDGVSIYELDADARLHGQTPQSRPPKLKGAPRARAQPTADLSAPAHSYGRACPSVQPLRFSEVR